MATETKQEIERRAISVDVVVEIPKDMPLEQFVIQFAELMESKGWYFGGGIDEAEDEFKTPKP